MSKYRNTEEYQKLMDKITRDSGTFFSLSGNFPNSEDFKSKTKEIMASYNGIIGMANREISDLKKELDSIKNNDSEVPTENANNDYPEVEKSITLEESLKSQIIEAALSKYTIGELWEKLK